MFCGDLELIRNRVLYERHGTPEYWYVDLDAERIEVYRLRDERYAPRSLFRGRRGLIEAPRPCRSRPITSSATTPTERSATVPVLVHVEDHRFFGPARICQHMCVAYTRIGVELSDALRAALDERAAREGTSRSELIGRILEKELKEDHEAEIGRRIVEGYRRVPDEGVLDAWARASAGEMRSEESW